MSCEPKLFVPTLPGRSNFNCLYVGKGPSMHEAAAHRDWGDIAVVNDAGSQGMLGNCRTVVTFLDSVRQPHGVSQDTDLIVQPGVPISPHDEKLRLAKLYQWQYQASPTHENFRRVIKERKPTNLSWPGPSGVLFLWLMGYRRIWLFGHDGGKGVAEGFADVGADYSGRREAIEFMQPLLAVDGCEVKFWPEVF